MLHRLHDLCAGQFLPRGGDDRRRGVVLTQQGHAGIQFLLGNTARAAQNDAVCMLDLVVIELAEVLHIHLALVRVRHGRKAVQHHVLHVQILHSTDHVAQFAYAGRLNEDPVRAELIQHLLQCLAEITHQAAADTAGIHLGDLNARVLQKAAVNGDLAEFVLDQHQLLTLKSLCDQFLDQRCLAGTQKAGKNIDLRHI